MVHFSLLLLRFCLCHKHLHGIDCFSHILCTFLGYAEKNSTYILRVQPLFLQINFLLVHFLLVFLGLSFNTYYAPLVISPVLFICLLLSYLCLSYLQFLSHFAFYNFKSTIIPPRKCSSPLIFFKSLKIVIKIACLYCSALFYRWSLNGRCCKKSYIT